MVKRICPRCGKAYKELPAISRKDNKTEICSECGIAEAMEAFIRFKNFEREDKE